MENTERPNSKQSGFSLIELMIAMVLGLFIIGGVLAVFISSSQSYRSNDALSNVQESGRFALEVIAHDLRNVGYKGACVSNVESYLNTLDADYEADAHDLNEPIMGWADDGVEFFAGSMDGYVNGTDIIMLKHAAETAEVILTSDVAQADTNFPATLNQVPNSQILIFSNGQFCNLFQNTRDTGDMAVARGNVGGNISNNIAADLTHSFKKDEMDINLLTSHLYYIGAGTTSATALHRLTYGMGVPVDQELVEGVSAMTVRYGVTSGVGGLDYSNTAADITSGDDWEDVLAVRVTLTITGDENIEHQFSTTVALRNRLTGL